jgi:galactokinase
MEKLIWQQFQEYFGKDLLLAAAPGRINLIGEHTDYNDGYVLPAAIDKNIYIGIAANAEKTLKVFAAQFNERFTFPLDDIHPFKGWPTYLLGMIYYLVGKKLPHGMDVYVEGDVPTGAGMSSSAALCSAFGVALNELFRLGLSRMEIALAGQKTEHHFAQIQCGIMDQFASMYGRAGQVMKLDCRNLEYEYIPFDYPEYRFVLVNTMVTHSLASSEYNVRRQQCNQGVQILQKSDPGIHSLRDVEEDLLLAHRGEMSELVFRRCHFVVKENKRLLRGCGLLENRDLAGFGALMYDSHDGLSREYEVSCAESDFLVNLIRTIPEVLGARQMGGGFGGCIINLIKAEHVPHFTSVVQAAYEKKYGKTPAVYISKIDQGARIIRKDS